MNNIVLQALPRFPARVDGGPGIEVNRANGVYTIESDYESLVPLSPVPDPTHVWIEVWNEQLDFYQRVMLSDISIVLGGGISDVVQDTSPQLGGNLDTNGHAISFADDNGFLDSAGNKLLWFQTTVGATNYFEFTTTLAAPLLAANGPGANIDLELAGKGTGGLRTTFAAAGLRLWDSNQSHRLAVSYDSDLTADRTLHLLTGDADRTLDLSAGSFAPSAFGLDLLDSPNAAAAQATLVLVPGTDVQAQSPVLSSLAGLTINLGDVFYGTGAGTVTRLPAGTDGQFLRTHGAGFDPDWSTPPSGGTIIGGPLSVLGRSPNTSGAVADISAPNGSGYVLRENAGTLAFGAPPAPVIGAGSITYAQIQNVTSDRLLGRDTASAGVVEELTVGGGLEFTGAVGIQRSALTGDVTAAAGGAATTIANGVVSNAKLANMTAPAVKARGTAGAGVPEDIAIGAGLVLDATSLRLDLGKQSVWIPAESWIPNTTGGPAAGSVETATNKNMVVTKDFDAAAIESIQKNVVLPKSWNKGTVTYQVYWSHAATTVNFGVVWGLAGYAISDGDGLDQVFPANITVTDTGGTTNVNYTAPESAAMTIGGTPATADMINLRLQRVATSGSDTLAVDARLAGVMLFYTASSLKDD